MQKGIGFTMGSVIKWNDNFVLQQRQFWRGTKLIMGCLRDRWIKSREKRDRDELQSGLVGK